MKVVVVWRDDTDYARELTDWMAEFERETGKKVESLSPDTVEGEIFVQAREIMEFPAIVAVDDRGAILKQWTGKPLPLFDEVAYYTKEY